MRMETHVPIDGSIAITLHDDAARGRNIPARRSRGASGDARRNVKLSPLLSVPKMVAVVVALPVALVVAPVVELAAEGVERLQRLLGVTGR